MDDVFGWMEHSALSEWVRGSDCICAFPTIVTVHNLAMAFLAGGGIAIDLRLLGFASQMPLKPMTRFVPSLWFAFAAIAVTGLLLLTGYPTKALTNPLFYFKLCLIALAAWLVHHIGSVILRAPEIDRNALPANARLIAVASLVVWLSLIAAGRFLGYTHKWEMLGVPAVL
jgi:hypothetical protein